MDSHELRGSRLLQLPREVRDLVLEHVLVKPLIPVECAATKAPARIIEQHELDDVYPLRHSRTHWRVWSVPVFDTGIVLDHDRSSDVHMTYQLTQEVQNANLALFRTCKQIYSEASKIFYGRNMFSFTSDFRIPTAFAFLCDRPAPSLLHIRSMELALMKANNMSGTARAHYPIINRSTDSFVLQYVYHYFTELCTLLSTSRMRLQNLRLTVETMSHGAENGCNSLGECIAWEEQHSTGPPPWNSSWLEPLLAVEALKSMEIRWVANRLQLLRVGDMVHSIQQHMLQEST